MTNDYVPLRTLIPDAHAIQNQPTRQFRLLTALMHRAVTVQHPVSLCVSGSNRLSSLCDSFTPS